MENTQYQQGYSAATGSSVLGEIGGSGGRQACTRPCPHSPPRGAPDPSAETCPQRKAHTCSRRTSHKCGWKVCHVPNTWRGLSASVEVKGAGTKGSRSATPFVWIHGQQSQAVPSEVSARCFSPGSGSCLEGAVGDCRGASRTVSRSHSWIQSVFCGGGGRNIVNRVLMMCAFSCRNYT